MSNPQIAFKPLPGSQSLALSCPCNEILYEGTRGPGKTAAQLARFRRLVGQGYGTFWRGVILDREYKDLSDLITQSKRMFNAFEDGAVFLKSPSELRWVWPTGEELLFRYGSEEDDYWNFHGQEFPFIGFNELTKQKNDKFYEAMMSCLRSSFRPQDYKKPDGTELPPIPLEVFSTTNPFGVGHAWVKKRFISPVPRGKVQRHTQIVHNPQSGEEEQITLTRVAIHGSYKENPYLDPIYIAKISSIKDPNKKAAWVDGSWDVTSGGRFDHLWDEVIHTLTPFKIPSSWRVNRSHDWGESKPFANLWWAESDGTPATINGKERHFPAKTIFLIGEWYGCEVDELNTGLRMTSSDVGEGVAWIDDTMTGKDIDKPKCVTKGEVNISFGICDRVLAGPADSSIFDTADNELSIADKMRKKGTAWMKANKKPGSRINGAAIFCEMLEQSIKALTTESKVAEEPAFYVFNNCRGWISRVPILPRDKTKLDDVDTDAEDHDWDATRYRILSSKRPAFSTNLKVNH